MNGHRGRGVKIEAEPGAPDMRRRRRRRRWLMFPMALPQIRAPDLFGGVGNPPFWPFRRSDRSYNRPYGWVYGY